MTNDSLELEGEASPEGAEEMKTALDNNVTPWHHRKERVAGLQFKNTCILYLDL